MEEEKHINKIKNIFPYLDGKKLDNTFFINRYFNLVTLGEVSELINTVISCCIDKLCIRKEITITDACAGVGGNAIYFALYFENVNAVEIEEDAVKCLQNNKNIQKLQNMEIYHSDYLKIFKDLKQDIVFIDPPWGGEDYKKESSITICLGNRYLEDLCLDIFLNCVETRFVVLKLPFNYDLASFATRGHLIWVYSLKKFLIVIVVNKFYVS